MQKKWLSSGAILKGKKMGRNVKYFNKTLKWHNINFFINEVLVFKRKTKERQKVTQIRTVMCGGDVTKLTSSRTKQVLKPPRAEAAFEEQQE